MGESVLFLFILILILLITVGILYSIEVNWCEIEIPKKEQINHAELLYRNQCERYFSEYGLSHYWCSVFSNDIEYNPEIEPKEAVKEFLKFSGITTTEIK